MKQGFELFWTALRHLISNFLKAVWTTGPAWSVLSVLTTLTSLLIIGDVASPSEGGDPSNGFVLPPFFWTAFMLTQCMTFMTLGYIGPKFHRAVLPENTKDLPKSYAEYTFALLQLSLIGIGLGFLASRLIALVSQSLPGPLTQLTLPVLALFAILYVIMRFSVILPSVAMGRPKSLHEAWQSTAPMRYAFATALLLLVPSVILLHALVLIFEFDDWSALVVSAVASWFALMIVLSYLNVIYRETRRYAVRKAREL